MTSGKRNKWLAVLLPLLVVTVVSAAPTVNNCSSSFVVSAVSPTSNVHIFSLPEVTQIVEPSDSHLARAAAEFLKPPPAFTSSPAPPIGAKSLPAVPGALFMGLTGFLCVSLVKDRRFWLAALTGLLWVGQTGIQAVPQLAVRISHRNHIEQQLDAKLTYQYNLENSRLRSDVDGTQYIGLLHHLAGIPDDKMSLLSQDSSQTEDEFRAPQFAIMGLSFPLIPATNCLAAKVEQFIYFSPAFIFDNLARGPPKLT
ncbi:MAG: hypothetical protein WBC22_12950 [Sedimentisphaerales bacterium]